MRKPAFCILLCFFASVCFAQKNALKGTGFFYFADESNFSNISIAYERTIAKNIALQSSYSCFESEGSPGYILQNEIRYYFPQKEKGIKNFYCNTGFLFIHNKNEGGYDYENDSAFYPTYHLNTYVLFAGIGKKIFFLKRLFFDVNFDGFNCYKSISSNKLYCESDKKWNFGIRPVFHFYLGFVF